VHQSTRRLTVGETFFSTMGIPVLRGRGFSGSDGEGATKVVVVNEAFARQLLPDEDPLGQRFRMWEAEWQIVGICRDAKYGSVKETVLPTTYFPYRQRFYSRFKQTHLRDVYFAVRTTLPPRAIVPAIRKAVAEIDADAAIGNITTQASLRDTNLSQERLLALLCTALAGLALLLSCIGLYGLMAYHVARRTGEIAVRMAMGATGRRVSGLILREALLLAVFGVAAGLPIVLALGRLIKSQLYGVTPSDPITLAATAVLLTLVAILSAWIPAWRASKIDPMVALKSS
jgi:predicted permease